MEVSAYSLLRRAEGSWWYAGRSAAVESALAGVESGHMATALDYGAGFGGMQSTLARHAAVVDALEPEPEARVVAKGRGYRAVYGSEQELQGTRYGLIGLFDVLEHLNDDSGFLERAKSMLVPGGRIIVSVPAYPRLWSEHDVEHHHFRRYTRASLIAAFERSGYTVEFASYWNCALLLPAAALRFLGKGGEGGLTPMPIVNRILTAVLKAEAGLMRIMPLPFGLSLVAVARVHDGREERKPRADIGRLVRYGIVGATGGLLQVVSLYVWVDVLHLSSLYLLGSIVGFCIALAYTFVLQKYWTFRNQGAWHTGRQALSYSSVALSGLALNAFLLAAAKWLIEAAGYDFFRGWYVGAQILAVGIVSATNYLLNSRITFKS